MKSIWILLTLFWVCPRDLKALMSKKGKEKKQVTIFEEFEGSEEYADEQVK